MAQELRYQFREITKPILLVSLTSLALLVCRVLATGSPRYWFLFWNLLLAWVPYLLSFAVVYLLQRYRTVTWQVVLLIISWLVFLPNTFYLTTDLIHLHNSGEVGILYDIVMMISFVLSGILLGFVSLINLHKLLARWQSGHRATGLLLLVMLLVSFAIYLGRYLRWNSWDIVANPGGLLYDTVDRLVRPQEHPMAATTTLLFFVFIASTYFGLLWLARALKKLI